MGLSQQWPWTRSRLSIIPTWCAHCLQRGCEIIGHGIGVRVINSTMSEQQEQAYIQQALDTLQRATGTAPVGWLGARVRRVISVHHSS